MCAVCGAAAAAPGVRPCVAVRQCDGSDSDARALMDFDRRMSAELLGDADEDRLTLSFLQQVRRMCA
jgi:hypothetical protein